MSSYKIAVVEWNDAWFSENLSSDVNCLRKTVGWLIQNNKRVVRIALTQDADGVQDIMNVPRAYVRSLRIIDPKQLRDETEADTVEAEVSA
jgi:hypothetical protein